MAGCDDDLESPGHQQRAPEESERLVRRNDSLLIEKKDYAEGDDEQADKYSRRPVPSSHGTTIAAVTHAADSVADFLFHGIPDFVAETGLGRIPGFVSHT